uniref:Uncharacterized protein n=1 Tax=Panagrellus redivivus TaxID=6233 RepID=A0A7E4VBC2_PANRE
MRGLGWRERRVDDDSARSRLYASAVYCSVDPSGQVESSLAGKLADQLGPTCFYHRQPLQERSCHEGDRQGSIKVSIKSVSDDYQYKPYN